jgi:hypothetical protein
LNISLLVVEVPEELMVVRVLVVAVVVLVVLEQVRH